MTKCKYEEYMISCFIDTVIYTQSIYLVDSLSYYKRYVFYDIKYLFRSRYLIKFFFWFFRNQKILQHFLMLCTCIYDRRDIRE